MPDIGICNHEICKCPITTEGNFCSEHCEEASKHEEVPGTACDCGHEGCV